MSAPIALPPGLPSRFLERLAVNESGCWLWSGALSSSGYPLALVGGRQRTLGPVFFAAFYGLRVDQVRLLRACSLSTRCLNPAHAHRPLGEQERQRRQRKAKAESWIPGLPARIAEKIEPIPFTGCWAWTAAVNPVTGYGHTYWKQRAGRYKHAPAHRIVYLFLRCAELLKHGLSLPYHLHVHHRAAECIGRLCCNPDHCEIKNNVRHASDHRRSERLEGRGWNTPESTAKSLATRAHNRAARKAARPAHQEAA